MMKRLLVVSIVVMTMIATAVLVSGTVALARDVAGEGQAKPNINCCFQDGQCLKTKKDNCALKKGIVVQDCAECPGVWGESKKEK
jgi:hypothetical protein